MAKIHEEENIMADDITIVVRLRDLASKNLAVVGSSLKTMGGVALSVAKNVALVGGAMSAIAGAATIAGIGKSVKVFADFDDTMRAVGAVTGATAEEMVALTAIAEKMGKTTKFSAAQAADGLRFLGMAGLDTNEQISALPNVLNLATAAAVDLGTSADIATNVLSGYGLEVESLARVNDVLVKGFTSSNTSLVELGESFKYVGPIAASAGADFEETVAAIGKLGDAGIKGSQAGTVLRSALARLLDPSKEAAGVLNELGSRIGQTSLEIKDAEGNFVGWEKLLRQLEDAGADTTDIIRLFGQEAGPGMAALLKAGSDSVGKFSKELKSAGGTTDRIAKEMGAGIGGAFRNMKSAFEAIQIAVGKAFGPDFTGIINRVTALFRKLADEISEFAKTEDFKLWSDVIRTGFDLAFKGIEKMINILKVFGKVFQATAYAVSGEWDQVQKSLQGANTELKAFYGFADEDQPEFFKIGADTKDSIKVLNKETGKFVTMTRKAYEEYLKIQDAQKAIGKGTKKTTQEINAEVKLGPSTEAQARSEFKKLQTIIQTEMAALEISYELGQVGLKQYFADREALVRESVESELEQLARLAEDETNADKRLAIQDKIFDKKKELETKLLELTAERIKKEEDLEREKIKKQEELNAQKIAIEQAFSDIKARLKVAEGESLRAEFLKEEADLQERQNRELDVLTENNAKKAEILEYERLQELEKLKLHEDQAKRLMQYRLNVAQEVASGVGDLFTEMYELGGKKQKEFFYLAKAAKIAEATINIANAVAGALGSPPYGIGAIANAALISSLGAIQLAKITSTGLAEGGTVPGRSPHKKADNIPIAATAGEFMQPVSAVDYYGAGVMEAIRQRKIPRELFSGFSMPVFPRRTRSRFAEGGSIGAGPQQKQANEDEGLKADIVNIVDPEMVPKYLNSTAGRKTVFNVLRSDPYSLKSIMAQEM
jgi:TP901 family phage tail tape measure protein